jgi:hypothetical protein
MRIKLAILMFMVLIFAFAQSSCPVGDRGDCNNEVVVFPDLKLAADIRHNLGKREPGGVITKKELCRLTEVHDIKVDVPVPKILFPGSPTQVDVIDIDILNLKGVEYCVNLQDLDLHGNQISDITPLASLTSLQWLGLWGNQISDLSPLASLTNLWTLYLGFNQISDLKPLVDNPGIGEGDIIDLYSNPLDNEACTVEIPALRERGVYVEQNTCP